MGRPRFTRRSQPAAKTRSRPRIGPLSYGTLQAQQQGIDAISSRVQHAVAHIACVVRTSCAHHRAPHHCPIVVTPRHYLRVAALPSLRILPQHVVIVRLAALMPVAACANCAPLSHVPFSGRYCPSAVTRSSACPSAARDRHPAHSNYIASRLTSSGW